MTHRLLKQRPEVAACYGHLKGVLAEHLSLWLIDREWLEVDRHGDRALNVQLTPVGWEGLERWGVDVKRLYDSDRKQVAICTERHRGTDHEHIGAHLGTLLREWLEERGLIEPHEGGMRLTEQGKRGLVEAGVLMPDLPPGKLPEDFPDF